MADAKDRFSGHASQYAAFRPTYPQALYDFIFQHVGIKDTAWDCATGNGQVAADLAKVFRKVYATDISSKQIENATRRSNIEYSVAPANASGLQDATCDLITVGQAIHWFDIPLFYSEVRRVAKPGALLAVWGYGLLKVNPEIDIIISEFYYKIIGPYWDPERKLVDEQYRTIPFPFQKIKSPEFDFSFSWTLEELLGYLSTWSSVQKYIMANGRNPVETLIARIKPIWKNDRHEVRFPLFLRTGKLN